MTEKVKDRGFSRVIVTTRLVGIGSTTTRLCSRFSLPTFVLRKYERQNDVVQHRHPRRFDFDPRLLFLQDVVRPVEFSNDRLLLVDGDQLHAAVQRRGYRLVGGQTRLGIVHPHCTHRPSILNAVWSSKRVTPGV